MELYIYGNDLNLNGVIDSFSSLRWVRKYYNTGEFQLTVPATETNCNLLQLDNIVYKKGSIEAGYIVSRSIERNSQGQEVIVAQGRFLTGYFSQRINFGILTFKGTVENLMRKVVNDNCINPTNTDRILPYWELGQENNFSETIECQDSYSDIETILSDLALNNDIGYRGRFDYKNKKMVFETYKGVDRSYKINSSTAPIIFSRGFENILTQYYYQDNLTHKNVGIVAGEGEGINRTITTIGSGIGINRKEVFIDARDLQSETEDGVMPNDEYEKLLINRGKERLSNFKEINTFESTINTSSNNKYTEDFDLGDIVSIVDKTWGLKVDSRITEVEEFYSEGYTEISITFGNSILTLIDKIKRNMR